MNGQNAAGAVLITMLLGACDGGSRAGTPAEAIHSCEILPADEVSRIFDVAVTDATPALESVNGSTANSQCSYRFENGTAGLTVQIRRSPSMGTKSRSTDAALARQQKDSLGIGEDVARAIEAGIDIKGLGSAAYEFEETGSYRQLVVYWDDHYQLTILHFGDTDGPAQATKRRELAQHVIANL